MTAALRVLAWALSAAALGLLLVAPNVNGPVLVVVWAVALSVFRFAALVPDRATRLVVGIVFLWACFLGAFSGGWFLIPAGIAFMLYDWRSNGRAVAQNAKE